MQIFIDGVDRTNIIDLQTLRISGAIGERSTASFLVNDLTNSLASLLVPGETVEIIHDGVKVFGGTIDRATQVKVGPDTTIRQYAVDCVDWHQICDRRVVAETYENRAAGDIVRDLVAKHLAAEGITYSDVDVSTGKESGMSASSYYGPGYEPSNLVDGSTVFGPRTAYASASGAALPQWVQIDLGVVRKIWRVRWINNRTSARLPRDYVIAVSVTGAFAGEEKVVATVTGNTTWAAWVEHTFPAIEARYVRMTVTAIYNGTYFEFAEWQIFADCSVQDGPNVIEAVFNYVPATTCLDKLAELAGFSWWIDANKVLHFVERATYSVPWALDDPAKVNNLRVEKHRQGYRNRQYVKAGKDVTDPQVEVFAGDGNAKTFVVGFPIAKVPTVEVSIAGGTWTAQTVGIKGIDEGKQWYWNKGDPTITQDQTGTVLSTADKIRITYQGFFDVVVLTDDYAAIEERKNIEGGTGYYEAVEDEPYLSSREAAIQSANAKLRKYAKLTKQITFDTYLPGLRPGQILTVNLPDRGLVNEEFLIESVEFSEIGGGYWNYSVRAVSGEALGGWTRFFRNMATRGQAFVIRENIREGQVLIRLVQSQEGWTWSEGTPVVVNACPIPSESQYPSSSLYPC